MLMESFFDRLAGFEEKVCSSVAVRFLVDVAARFSRQKVSYASKRSTKSLPGCGADTSSFGSRFALEEDDSGRDATVFLEAAARWERCVLGTPSFFLVVCAIIS